MSLRFDFDIGTDNKDKSTNRSVNECKGQKKRFGEGVRGFLVRLQSFDQGDFPDLRFTQRAVLVSFHQIIDARAAEEMSAI